MVSLTVWRYPTPLGVDAGELRMKSLQEKQALTVHDAVAVIWMPGADAPPFRPDQNLNLRTAVRAYTAGSAYVNHLDDTGILSPGYRADLVVLDRDPFAAPPTEIGDCTVASTYVDGRRVH